MRFPGVCIVALFPVAWRNISDTWRKNSVAASLTCFVLIFSMLSDQAFSSPGPEVFMDGPALSSAGIVTRETDERIPPESWIDLGNPFQKAVAMAFSGDIRGAVDSWEAGLADRLKLPGRTGSRTGTGLASACEGPDDGREYFIDLGLTPWPPDFIAVEEKSVPFSSEAQLPMLEAHTGINAVVLGENLARFIDSGVVNGNPHLPWGWKPATLASGSAKDPAKAATSVEEAGKWAISVGLYREARDCFAAGISDGNLDPALENSFMTARVVDSMLARLFAEAWNLSAAHGPFKLQSAAEIVLYFTEAYPEPWWWLAGARLDLGDLPGALFPAERAASMGGPSTGPGEVAILARTLDGSGQTLKAIDRLFAYRTARGVFAFSSRPPVDPDPGLAFLEADMLKKSGRTEDALALFESILSGTVRSAWDPADIGRAELEAAEILFDAGRYTEAADRYEAARRGLGGFPETFIFNRAICYLKTGRREEALKDLVSTVGSGADCAEARRLLALEFLDPDCRLYDPDVALEHAEKAAAMCTVEMPGEEKKSLLCLAFAAATAGKDQEARKAVDRFRKKFPGEAVPESVLKLLKGE